LLYTSPSILSHPLLWFLTPFFHSHQYNILSFRRCYTHDNIHQRGEWNTLLILIQRSHNCAPVFLWKLCVSQYWMA
jgi:hypothetical protein